MAQSPKGFSPNRGSFPNPTNPPDSKTDWTRLAIEAAKASDYETAVNLFVNAVSQDPRNAGLRYNLAIALERNGEIDDATVSLSEALRLKPDMVEAAGRLTRILSKYDIEEPGRIDASGLFNAMAIPDTATQPLGSTAIEILKIGGPLREAIDSAALTGWDDVAEALITSRTAPLLRDPLLLRSLASHVNCDIELEHLLLALRRTVLKLPPERFGDKTVLGFTIALAKQCLQNEHVFEVSEQEQEMVPPLLEAATLKQKMLPADIKAVMVTILYQGTDALLAKVPSADILKTLKPKALREFILPLHTKALREDELLGGIESVGALSDLTSRKVAAQYEDNPYPRWTSFRALTEGIAAKALSRFVPQNRLGFMAQPFDVLIAGCGTGRQALEAAVAYGPNAKLTAIDISRRSLAYAKREADARGIRNITFLEADLLDPDALARTFDIIECVGVLHHLEQPLKGLEALEKRLRPGGLMQIALYSAVSREELSELRHEPTYPGTDCTPDEARRYRAEIRDRLEEETGGELTRSLDFWSLSGFRDLVLHVSEQQFILPDIATALDDLNLHFRGFTLHPQMIEDFEAAYPDDRWPGTLVNWWEHEQENPRLFDGMYSFWVEKTTD